MVCSTFNFKASNYYLAYNNVVEHTNIINKIKDSSNSFANLISIEPIPMNVFRCDDEIITQRDINISRLLTIATLIVNYAPMATICYFNPEKFLTKSIIKGYIYFSCFNFVRGVATSLRYEEPAVSLAKKVNDFFETRAAYRQPTSELLSSLKWQVIMAGATYGLSRWNWCYFSTPYLQNANMAVINAVISIALVPLAKMAYLGLAPIR